MKFLLLLPCVLLLAVRGFGKSHTDTVYRSDFSKGVNGGSLGPGITQNWTASRLTVDWSNPVQTVAARSDGRVFLGQFGNQDVALRLANIPRHDSLRISFTLYIINTWDGNIIGANALMAPDIVGLTHNGLDTLLNATFANNKGTTQSYPQNLPSSGPPATNPPKSGAYAINVLDMPDKLGGNVTEDAAYRISCVIPDDADTALLFFYARLRDGSQLLSNESWGLDSILVETVYGGPTISYLIPDVGAPGMNTLVEIIGPHNGDLIYGVDSTYLNNPADRVKVLCAVPADTSKIVIGPIIVSQNGKMISTQVFVLPDQQPNSWDWQSVSPPFRIPMCVVVDKDTSSLDTFYIVQPQQALVLSSGGSIGSGGMFGVRSRRGAMIVDSVSLTGTTPYTVSTADCDPATPGNQGYLPFTMLSVGKVDIQNAQLSVSATGIDGAAGGAGGGGVYDDDMAGAAVSGGSGYSGGEGGGTMAGGEGTGSSGYPSVPGVSYFSSAGGVSLNGMEGGEEKLGALECYQLASTEVLAGSQGCGGGSGFPFGSSGTGGFTRTCILNNTQGGCGGGSGSGECEFGSNSPPLGTSFGGGGGGNGTSGKSVTSGAGSKSGNAMLVPVHGGSGGGGGNPWQGVSGYGGGGGGAISVFSARTISAASIAANGANGGNVTRQFTADCYSGAGGGGSGGGIVVTTKGQLAVQSVTAAGGKGGIAAPRSPKFIDAVQNGGDGGSGMLRMDGFYEQAAVLSPPDATFFRGPATDTSTFVPRRFTLTGTGNGNQINLYTRSQTGSWRLTATVPPYPAGTWSQTVDLSGGDSLYFLVATQDVPNPDQNTRSREPVAVMSQAGANVLRIDRETAALCLDDTLGTVVPSTPVDATITLSVGRPIPFDSIEYALHFNESALHFERAISNVCSCTVRKIGGGSVVIVLRSCAAPLFSGTLCTVSFTPLASATGDTVHTQLAIDSVNVYPLADSVLTRGCAAPITVVPACGLGGVGVVFGGVSTIGQNYPNPFNGSTTIRAALVENDIGKSCLTVRNMLGGIVADLTSKLVGDGTIVFSAEGLASGLYTCVLETPSRVQRRQLCVVH